MSLACTSCGGHGTEEGCPECKKVMDSLNLDTPESESSFLTVTKWALIPEEFRTKIWRKEILLQSKADLESSPTFRQYADALERFHKTFVLGTISNKSGVIVAPANFSKTVLCYSCMQQAIKHKIRVSPILDTLELRRLMMASAVNPTYKLYNKIGYDDYMANPILFVKVTLTEERNFSLPIIRELLDRRARMGYPTYIVSECPVEQWGSGYRDNSIASLIGIESFSNKYPVIIQYLGG